MARACSCCCLSLWAYGGWRTSQAVSIKREEPVSQLMSVVPPPPTPPPPKPQQVVKENVPVPTTQPQQVQPKAQAPANNAITENADAQGRSRRRFQHWCWQRRRHDWRRRGRVLQPGHVQRLHRKCREGSRPKGRRPQEQVLPCCRQCLALAQGKITKATLRTSTGSDAYDQALTALLLAMPPLEQPPPQQILARLPVEMTVDLRKSL